MTETQEMWQDPIVKEVREIRKAYAAQFNYDLLAIHRDLKEQERISGRQTVSFPPRKAQSHGWNAAPQQTGVQDAHDQSSS